MNQKDTNCPICQERYFTEIAQKDRYGTATSSLLCMGCGVVFLNPRLELDRYDEFYTNDYRTLVSKYWGKEISPEVVDDDARLYGESLSQFFRNTPYSFRGVDAIDLGGSSGVAAEILQNELGLAVTVLDPNQEELSRAKSKGLSTIQGTIEDKDISSLFGMILMCRTIDHLFDPVAALGKVYEALPQGGWFYVDIVDWLAVARSEGVVDSLHIDHPFNFTPDSFRAILRDHGFMAIREHISPEHLGPNSGVIEHGFLCKKYTQQCYIQIARPKPHELLREIRALQAAERKIEVTNVRPL